MVKKLFFFALSVALIGGAAVYFVKNSVPVTTRIMTEELSADASELMLTLSKADGRGIIAMSLRLGDTGKLVLIGRSSEGRKIPVTIDTQDIDNIYFQQYNPNTVTPDEFLFHARKVGTYDYTFTVTDAGKTLTKNVQFIIRPALNIQANITSSCVFPDTDSPIVRDLCLKGIISGYPDGTFRPETIVNRAEMMKIAYQLFGNQAEIDVTGASLKASNTFSFVDVEPGHWAAPYIAIAKNLGKIQGYPDGTFVPFQEVKRAEAWKMMIEAATNGDVVLQAAFDQVKPGPVDDPWFGPYARFGKKIGMRLPGENELPEWMLMSAPVNRLEVVDFTTKIINFIPTESVVLER